MNKTYPARCHVCRVEFDYPADFLSCAQWADGRAMISCGAHSGAEIYAAWLGNGRPTGFQVIG